MRNNKFYGGLNHILFFLFFLIVYCEGQIVKTSKGKIQGTTYTVLVDGRARVVSAFLGIPFGHVPQRFSAPQEALPWKPKTLIADKQGASCFHSDDKVFPGFPGAEMWNAPNNKDENCLFLNIWSPAKNVQNMPPTSVMVWIYGGSFFFGTSALELYDGRYLAAYGQVVVVSLNYRLGPLGFMPELGEDAPGNVGLLDQNLALKWVKNNIRTFGGNPQLVTLFGESSGAVSTGLHLISPLSRGLFQRIILQSGSHTAGWAAISPELALSRAKQLAKNLDCPGSTNASKSELLTCFRGKSAREIYDVAWMTTETFDFPFVPVYRTKFIPEDPKKMTKVGKQPEVDILAGFNTNEGVYFALYSIPGFSLNHSSYITKKEFLNGLRLSGLQTNEMGFLAVSFMYEDWNFPENPSRYRDALDQIIGHYHVTCPVINVAKLHSSIFPSSKVFLYHFAYRISNNPWPQWAGVMHGYEIELVFGLPFINPKKYTDEDRRVSRRILDAWTNFAKLGYPADNATRRWPQYNSRTQSFVEISSLFDSFRTPSPLAFECAFWEKYLPTLKLASSDINEMKAMWTGGFNRWTDSMDRWETARVRKDNRQCGNKRAKP